MSDENKLLKITTLDGTAKLYYGSFIVPSSLNMVKIDEALYVVREDAVTLSTGKKTVLQLVQSGKHVYYLS